MSVSVTKWLSSEVPELARQTLIRFVEEQKQRVHAEQASRSGIGVSPDLETMIIDGHRGATAIQAGSRVTLDWNYITEAVIKTITAVTEAGPERSGTWKSRITLLIDGREHPRDTPIPADTAIAQVVFPVPYARRLEVGKTESGRAFAVQVPQHYIEASMLRLRSQLRELAEFEFGYVDLASARHTRSPCITIKEIKAI